MRIPFSILFLALVFAEIAGFVLVGQAIGVLGTLALVFLGMVGGLALLRRQGIATLTRVRAELATGGQPGRPLAEGAAQVTAALLIIVPGFVTDVIGLALLVPGIRAALWRWIAGSFGSRVTMVRRGGRGGSARPARTVIDLDPEEYGERQPGSAPGNAGSPWRRQP